MSHWDSLGGSFEDLNGSLRICLDIEEFVRRFLGPIHWLCGNLKISSKYEESEVACIGFLNLLDFIITFQNSIGLLNE